jgi:hypothetical protein
MVAQAVVDQTLFEPGSRNAPVNRANPTMMPDFQSVNGPNLPAMHASQNLSRGIDTTERHGPIATKRFKTGSSEKLNGPCHTAPVVQLFDEFLASGIQPFEYGTSNQSEPRFRGTKGKELLEVVRLEGHVRIKVSDELVPLLAKQRVSSLKCEHLRAEGTFSVRGGTAESDEGVAFRPILNDLVSPIGGSVTHDNVPDGLDRLCAHGFQGPAHRGFLITGR